MVEHARAALDPERATVRQADLTELTLDEPADAAFSNAVFHWIADHDTLFRRLHAALRPGGRLVAQCGGAATCSASTTLAREVASEEPYAPTWPAGRGPGTSPAPRRPPSGSAAPASATSRRWLEPYPVAPRDPTGYLRSVCLGYHLEQLPEELRAPYVEAVRERCGRELDYVRLNIVARRPTD